MLKSSWIAVWALLFSTVAMAQQPVPLEGDFVVKDFRFRSGETLPALRLHYRTLGELFEPGGLLDANRHYIVPSCYPLYDSRGILR